MNAEDETTEDTQRLVGALERSRPQLKWIMASYRLSKEDAEDLLQDVALLALAKMAEIRNLDHWLTGTARKLCFTRLRSKRRRAWVPLEEFLEPACPPAQERMEFLTDLERGLDALPAHHRTVLVLHALGYTFKEIAALTGYSLGSVNKFADRGAGRLAEAL